MSAMRALVGLGMGGSGWRWEEEVNGICSGDGVGRAMELVKSFVTLSRGQAAHEICIHMKIGQGGHLHYVTAG